MLFLYYTVIRAWITAWPAYFHDLTLEGPRFALRNLYQKRRASIEASPFITIKHEHAEIFLPKDYVRSLPLKQQITFLYLLAYFEAVSREL